MSPELKPIPMNDMSASYWRSITKDCRQITVGFGKKDLQHCPNFGTVETTVANCLWFDLNRGYHWLKLIESFISRPKICDQSVFRYELFEGKFNTVLANLYQGTVDLYPIKLALDGVVERNLTFTKQISNLDYNFYVKIDESNVATRVSIEASFLSAPFQSTTWSLIAVALAFVLALQTLIDQLRRSRSAALRFDRFYGVGLSLPLALICAAYSSSLKSLVIQKSHSEPFRSLTELADQLIRNERELIIEDNQNMRYNLMVKREHAKSDEMRYLQDAVEKSPIKVINSMEEVCRLLISSEKFTFIGYDQLIVSKCNVCFWRHPLIPDERINFAFILPTNSNLYELANMAAYALPNYLEILTRKRTGKICNVVSSNQQMINLTTLIYAFAYVGGIWLLASAIFISEVIYYHLFVK